MATEGKRTYWRAEDLGIKNEPLIVSLIQYRQKKNRRRVAPPEANLLSSKTTTGRQKPILDLDFEFRLTDTHLYLHTPMFGPVRRRVAVLLLHGIWNWLLRSRL